MNGYCIPLMTAAELNEMIRDGRLRVLIEKLKRERRLAQKRREKRRLYEQKH